MPPFVSSITKASFFLGIFLICALSTAQAFAAPTINSPAPGSQLPGSSVTFSWTANGTTVSQWWIHVGTSQGDFDLFDSGSLGGSLSDTVSGLPTNGGAVWVRLWYLDPVSWKSIDVQYTAANGGGGGTPSITSPTPGSTLPGSSASFTWAFNGAAVTDVWLEGTTVPQAQAQSTLFSSGSLGTSLSYTATGLPTNGQTIYIQLYYLVNGNWSMIEVQYTMASTGGGGGTPNMVAPAPGSVLTGSTVTFSWDADGTAVSQWWMHVGTSQGATDLFDSGSLGGALSTTVSSLPTNGGTVWVRLWYLDPTSWKSIDVQYTAAPNGGGGGDTPTMTTPAPGTTLTGSSVTFTWTANDATVSQWWIHVGTSKGAFDIFDSGSLGGALSSTISGLPSNGGPVWIRLWYLESAWKSIDAQYTAATGGGITFTAPQNNALHTSTSVDIQVTTSGFPSNWGVEFVIDGNEANSIEVSSPPYETNLTGLSKTEHTVTAYMVNENSIRQTSTATNRNFGVGDYYVGFGDSITFGVGDTVSSDDTSADGRNSGGGYTPILNNLLTSAKNHPHTVVNETIPGFESGDGLAVIGDALNTHPDSQYFLILFGTNDSTPPMAVPSGLNLSPGNSGYPGSFKDNMKQIIDAIKNAGKHPLLSKVPIRYGDCSQSSQCNSYLNPASAQANLDIQQYNMVIDQLILENNLDVDPINNPGTLLTAPDLYTFFEGTGVDGQGKSPQFFDWLHPNGTGYQSLSNLWLQALTP